MFIYRERHNIDIQIYRYTDIYAYIYNIYIYNIYIIYI